MGQPFVVYILHCADGSYYVGHTDHLETRMEQHASGLHCRYTRKRRPVHLVWVGELASRDDAKRADRQLKGWTRAKKEALIEGRFGDLRRLASRARAGGPRPS